MTKKLAIITVNYQSYQDTEEFLQSFQEQSSMNFSIYIADLSKQKQTITNPLVSDKMTVFAADNRGYAYGLNVGLKRAIADGFSSFVFLNNDTVVAKDFVRNVLGSLQAHPGSLIGGKVYYYKGYEFHKDKYKKNDLGKVLWYAGGTIDWEHAIAKHRGVDETDRGDYDTFEETAFVTGCLMAFDQNILDAAGFMDEGYFLYYEDADWNERIKRAGQKIYYDPTIVIWHKNAQSTGGSGSDLHRKFQEGNRLKFGLKYAPWRTKAHLLKNAIMKV